MCLLAVGHFDIFNAASLICGLPGNCLLQIGQFLLELRPQLLEFVDHDIGQLHDALLHQGYLAFEVFC